MKTSVSALMLISAAALVLSGCQSVSRSFENAASRTGKITNVVGNVWRADAVWPGEKNTNQLSEHLYERAYNFCRDRNMLMLPGRGALTEGSADGATPASGWMEFRCQPDNGYKPEYMGLTHTFDPSTVFSDEGTGK